jgi:sulfur carrier protein
MVKVNGEEVSTDRVVLMDFLLKNGYDPRKIAVEINGEILPKSQYSTKELSPDDAVEIVGFVGGG